MIHWMNRRRVKLGARCRFRDRTAAELCVRGQVAQESWFWMSLRSWGQKAQLGFLNPWDKGMWIDSSSFTCDKMDCVTNGPFNALDSDTVRDFAVKWKIKDLIKRQGVQSINQNVHLSIPNMVMAALKDFRKESIASLNSRIRVDLYCRCKADCSFGLLSLKDVTVLQVETNPVRHKCHASFSAKVINWEPRSFSINCKCLSNEMHEHKSHRKNNQRNQK